MAHILVDTRMPNLDHMETRDLDRMLEHDEPLVVLLNQPGWNEGHKIVGLQHSVTSSRFNGTASACARGVASKPR
jgi:hypothetical protein